MDQFLKCRNSYCLKICNVNIICGNYLKSRFYEPILKLLETHFLEKHFSFSYACSHSIELLKNFIVQINKIALINRFYETKMDEELIFQQLLM